MTFSLRNQDGEEIENGYASRSLRAGARLALLIDELFSESDLKDFSGEVVIRTETGKIAAVAIEIGNASGELTSLPVSRLEKID